MAETPLSSERVEEIRARLAAIYVKSERACINAAVFVGNAATDIKDLLSDHDRLVRENAELRKKIAFGVGWLGAMLERRQYENDTELHEFRDELSAALTSGPSNAKPSAGADV